MKWVHSIISVDRRIGDIEKSITEIMNDIGEDEIEANRK